MPNHITTCISISGNVNDFEKEYMTEGQIDFEKIIPQPENMFRGNLGKKEKEECRKMGRPNWYDWQSEYWGTKWNAYQTVIVRRDKDAIHLKFETAWATPIPIIKKLKEIGFTVVGIWKDEGDDSVNTLNDDCGDWWTDTAFKLDGTVVK